MTQLLALSCDALASPTISFKPRPVEAETADAPYGWGMAWYPPGDQSASCVKDPTSPFQNAMALLLHDWERFRSTTFVCHLRGAAQRASQEDTQPFVRSFAGRDFVIAHNGQLRQGWVEELVRGADALLEPVGHTDSEHLLCWLLANLREGGHRRLADTGWGRLHAWFQRANELGTLNVLISDGDDIVAYQDAGGFNRMHWHRRTPPHASGRLENDEVIIALERPDDASRTAVVIATSPLSDEQWSPLGDGRMIVLRRGAIIWDSRGQQADGAPAPPRRGEPPARRGASVLVGEEPVAPDADAPDAATAFRLEPDPPAASAPANRGVYRITHATRYRYDEPVERSRHVLRLHPVHDLEQTLLSHELSVTPSGPRRQFEDVFGNQVVRVDFNASFAEMQITSTSLLRLHPSHRKRIAQPRRHMTIPLVWMPWQRQMMLPYLLPPELPATQLRELFDYAMGFVERQDYDVLETLLDINRSIYRDYDYVPGSTQLSTTPFDVYTSRRGVCQDFANLLICLARLLELPARYRVGYIYTGGDYANKVQSDASHAWAEVYLPWAGWVGLDPTNGCLAGLDHVRVAAGRNYVDASPTSGTIYAGGQGESLEISVRVEPASDDDLEATSPPSGR